MPAIQSGKKVIIAAHGNSLRALVKHLDRVSDQEIVGLNIPTGVPLVYELDEQLEPLRHYYLGDPEAIAKAWQPLPARAKRSRLAHARPAKTVLRRQVEQTTFGDVCSVVEL